MKEPEYYLIPQILRLTDCHKNYTEKDVRDFEIIILSKLSWDVSAPISFEISSYLIKLLPFLSLEDHE
jgi:hypothetical protein